MKLQTSKILASLALLCSCAGSLPNLASAQQRVAPEPKSLEIQISAPTRSGKRVILLDPTQPHLNVIFRNVSDGQLLLFEEWNSWGFGKLHLEITKVDGKALPKSLYVTQGNGVMVWSANSPSIETLNLKESFVREVYFNVPAHIKHPELESANKKADERANTNRYDYWRFPFPMQSQRKTVTMKAVYEVKPDWSSKKENAWTGRIESAPLTYEIGWAAPRR